MKKRTHSQPEKTKELYLMQLLRTRMSFTPEEHQRLNTLQRGFTGERKFYKLLLANNLTRSFLFDLFFTINRTSFQLDNIYVTNNAITIFEVKYYAGDFYIENDKWYILRTNQEIRNPLDQLRRSELLLRQLLQQSYPHVAIHSKLIFIHDEFTLYNAPVDLPAILPTQLPRYVQQLRRNQPAPSAQVGNISKFFISLHRTDASFSTLPTYTYNNLRKGMTCENECGGFLVSFAREQCICQKCHNVISKEKAIYNAIVQFHALFPEKKITTSAIWKWCKDIQSKHVIRRVLKKYLIYQPNGKYSHYILHK